MAARITNNNLTPLLEPDPAVQVSAEEVSQTLESIFRSKYFIHAPKKQRFLQLISDYYLNGQAAELNEYLIGCEVFERGPAYNPQADPIVRVGAHDIRKKLELYYQNEGAADPFRLIVPLGKYEPVFARHPLAETAPASALGKTASLQAQQEVVVDHERPVNSQPSAPVAPTAKKSVPSWVRVVSGSLIVLAAALTGWFVGVRGGQPQREPAVAPLAAKAAQDSPVWQLFLNEKAPTLLILSNPTVYRSANESDPLVATRQGVVLSAEQARLLTSTTGNRLPSLADQIVRLIPAFSMYTGIGEAIGAYQISTLLQAAGEPTLLKQSRSVGPEDFKQYDTILLGSVYSNQWSKPLSLKENFVYTAHATIQNLEPLAGEAREYKAVFDQRSGVLLEDYALISVTPGVSGAHTLMVLAGLFSEGTQAAAEFVTAANTLPELNQRLQPAPGKSAPPRYYQALLKVRVENAFPTKSTLIAFRELKANSE